MTHAEAFRAEDPNVARDPTPDCPGRLDLVGRYWGSRCELPPCPAPPRGFPPIGCGPLENKGFPAANGATARRPGRTVVPQHRGPVLLRYRGSAVFRSRGVVVARYRGISVVSC